MKYKKRIEKKSSKLYIHSFLLLFKEALYEHIYLFTHKKQH